MRVRLQHISLVLTAASLLAGGCGDRRALDIDGSDISFGVEAIQLVEETKKGSTLDQRNYFDNGNVIYVSAWHKGDQGGDRVFRSGGIKEVTLQNKASNLWTYDPKEKWLWKASDYYDFLAVYPVSPSSAKPETSPLYVAVDYNAASSQYDLLMAGTQRRVSYRPDPSEIVRFSFRHALSAVRVVFIQDPGSSNVTLKRFGFKNLITSGSIQGYISTDVQPEFIIEVKNPVRPNSEMFTWTGTEDLSSGDFDPYAPDPGIPGDTEHFELMLPQNLNLSLNSPQLVVEYQMGAYSPNTHEVSLKDIPVKNTTDNYIDKWESGMRYIYEIHFLLKGGVLVNVFTTPWEPVEAQTPGLIL